jgi:hypothetical protein
MNELDLHTVEEALNAIALELGASALERVKALNGNYTQPSWFFDRNAPFDGDRDAQLVLWHHHMGTTRILAPVIAFAGALPGCLYQRFETNEAESGGDELD